MLSRLCLLPANALRGSGFLGAGLVHASRSLHTSQRQASQAPLPEGAKFRLGFIPDDFFQFFYPKTGVTGPYMFGTGLITYLVSKEVYVINDETVAGMVIIAILVYAIKKYGASFASFADKLEEEKRAAIQQYKDEGIADLTQAIENEKREQQRTEAISLLFTAKKNNVIMLLETNYRERLHMVTSEVKKRLDYHAALQELHRRMAREHMIKWVEKSVISSITAQQEKESIAKCITDLKALAKSSKIQARA
ncbi:ATP synthase peripheral stalk subunit b, mitochondrial [Aulostomus maculatus]